MAGATLETSTLPAINEWEITISTWTNQSDFFSEMESEWTFKLGTFINKYWPTILLPIGLISNTICFLVMNMKQNKKLSTCRYMSIIAVNDNLVLLTSLFEWITEFMIHFEYTVLACKIYIFIFFVILIFGAYEIMFMTFDKFYAIQFPLKAARFCTAKRALKISSFNLIIAVIVCCPQLYFSGLFGVCIRYTIDRWYTSLYAIIFIIYYPVVPIASLFVMNISIIKSLWLRRKNTDIIIQNSQQHVEWQVTMMLIVVSTVFVILLSPFEVRAIYVYFIGKGSTPKSFAKFALAFSITNALLYANNAINFYLYLLSGKKFRNDLQMLFRKRSTLKRRSNSSVQTISNEISIA